MDTPHAVPGRIRRWGPGLLVLALAFWGRHAMAQPMTLKSPVFENGQPIPVTYTCEGEDKSPPLTWSGAPEGTKSFALAVFDPDAPRPQGWVHWVVVDLPPDTTDLPAGADLPPGARAVQNDFGKQAYGGPCPPPGHGVHRYQFTLWALPTAHLEPLPEDYQALVRMADAKALATARLEGRYERD